MALVQWLKSRWNARKLRPFGWLSCEKCKGKGKIVGFAIPLEDFEKGYSGYALYSCNRINAVYGCVNCGGAGVIYERWYLEENPELVNDQPSFKLGTGLCFGR